MKTWPKDNYSIRIYVCW